jgi:hypothetical protein
LAQCRDGTAGHPSTGGRQLLPGRTISLGPSLRLSASPYGQMLVPISVLQSFDHFHCGLFFRDFLTLRYGLHFFQAGLHYGHYLLIGSWIY